MLEETELGPKLVCPRCGALFGSKGDLRHHFDLHFDNRERAPVDVHARPAELAWEDQDCPPAEWGAVSCLEVLNLGVEVWNEWRCDYPDVKPELAESELAFCDLPGVNLSHADLNAAVLVGSNLQEARFEKATCSGVDMKGANLAGTDCRNSVFACADLREANLTEADFAYANLSSCDMSNVLAEGASFVEARLAQSSMVSAILNRASFNDSVLRRAQFRDAKLNGATFRGADLTHADFTGADLRDADLRGAKINYTRFTASNMAGVILHDTILCHVRLQGANLQNAHLNEYCESGHFPRRIEGATILDSDLRGVDLSLADVRGVKFENVRFV